MTEKISLKKHQAQETSNDKGSEFIHESAKLLYYYFHNIDIRRAESYIKSPNCKLKSNNKSKK